MLSFISRYNVITYSLKYLTLTDYQVNKNMDILGIAIQLRNTKCKLREILLLYRYTLLYLILIGEIIDYTFLHPLLYMA